jgi:hypothetical protein
VLSRKSSANRRVNGDPSLPERTGVYSGSKANEFMCAEEFREHDLERKIGLR